MLVCLLVLIRLFKRYLLPYTFTFTPPPFCRACVSFYDMILIAIVLSILMTICRIGSYICISHSFPVCNSQYHHHIAGASPYCD